jgi:hypothetical protein
MHKIYAYNLVANFLGNLKNLLPIDCWDHVGSAFDCWNTDQETRGARSTNDRGEKCMQRFRRKPERNGEIGRSKSRLKYDY